MQSGSRLLLPWHAPPGPFPSCLALPYPTRTLPLPCPNRPLPFPSCSALQCPTRLLHLPRPTRPLPLPHPGPSLPCHTPPGPFLPAMPCYFLPSQQACLKHTAAMAHTPRGLRKNTLNPEPHYVFQARSPISALIMAKAVVLMALLAPPDSHLPACPPLLSSHPPVQPAQHALPCQGGSQDGPHLMQQTRGRADRVHHHLQTVGGGGIQHRTPHVGSGRGEKQHRPPPAAPPTDRWRGGGGGVQQRTPLAATTPAAGKQAGKQVEGRGLQVWWTSCSDNGGL